MTTNLKIHVSCMPQCEKEIKQLVWDILIDYCTRFNLLALEGTFTINICLLEYDPESSRSGCTIYSEEQKKILIQMRDPFLNDWEDNPYTISVFLNILCHEIIHACQHITARKGFAIPKMFVDTECPAESYFFEAAEVEARVLADFYADKFASKLL